MSIASKKGKWTRVVVAVCCNVLQGVALLCIYSCGLLEVDWLEKKASRPRLLLQCVMLCCIVLRCGPSVSILPRALGSRLPRKKSGLRLLLRFVAMRCGVLQGVALLCLYCCGLLKVNCLEQEQVDSSFGWSVLWYVAVCCSVLQYVAAQHTAALLAHTYSVQFLVGVWFGVLQCAAVCVVVCCSVLQCVSWYVAVCCSVCCGMLQCAALCAVVCCSVLQCVLWYVAVSCSVCCIMLQCAAVCVVVCCSVPQCVLWYVAVCCSVCCGMLQCAVVCVVVCCSALQCVWQCAPVCCSVRSSILFILLLQCFAICCSVLRCVALLCSYYCCSGLQCVAVCCRA